MELLVLNWNIRHLQRSKSLLVVLFGQRIYHIDDLKEAMSLYVMDAVSRLRDDNLLCGCLIGFVQSNPFDSSKPFYNKSLSLALPEPTDNLLVLSKLATTMIDGLYAKDIAFKKCGVILTCLEPKAKPCI